MKVAILAPRGGGAEQITSILFAPSESGSTAVIIAEELNPSTIYRLGGVWTARPIPPAPPQLVANVETVWEGLPTEATVTIIDPMTGLVAIDAQGNPAEQVVGGTGSISLKLPEGPWTITVSEVFPFQPAQFNIEVLVG